MDKALYIYELIKEALFNPQVLTNSIDKFKQVNQVLPSQQIDNIMEIFDKGKIHPNKLPKIINAIAQQFQLTPEQTQAVYDLYDATNSIRRHVLTEMTNNSQKIEHVKQIFSSLSDEEKNILYNLMGSKIQERIIQKNPIYEEIIPMSASRPVVQELQGLLKALFNNSQVPIQLSERERIALNKLVNLQSPEHITLNNSINTELNYDLSNLIDEQKNMLSQIRNAHVQNSPGSTEKVLRNDRLNTEDVNISNTGTTNISRTMEPTDISNSERTDVPNTITNPPVTSKNNNLRNYLIGLGIGTGTAALGGGAYLYYKNKNE